VCWEVWALQEYKKQEYVETVADQIRCKRARILVEEEIVQHIEDQMLDYIEHGMNEAEAEAEAVRQMGDPVTVGTDLDRIHRPKLDIKLFLLMAILMTAGLAVQFLLLDGSSQGWFLRQLLITEMSLAVMFFIYRLDYTFFAANSFGLWGVWGLVVIVGTCFALFPQIYGQYQMHYYLLASVPIYAGILYRFRENGYRGLWFCGGIAAVNLSLCLMAPDFAAMAELLVIYAAMLTWAVHKGWFCVRRVKGYLTIYIPIGIVTGMTLLSSNDYWIRRWDTAFHPEKYPETYGYVACMIRESLKNLPLLGGSVADKGIETVFPAATVSSDMIFTHILARYGLAAGVLLLGILAVLIFKAFMNAFRQKNQLGSMIGFGCACILATQTITYVMYNLGFTFFGVTHLPFLSRSGVGMLFTCFYMGLILSVYRSTNIMKERPLEKLPRYRVRIEKIAE